MFDVLISSCRCQQVTGRIILSFVPPQNGLKPKLDSFGGKIGRERERGREKEGGRGPSLSDTLGGNLYFASENLNVLHLY